MSRDPRKRIKLEHGSPLDCENLVVKDDFFWADDKVCYKSLKTSEGIGRAGLFDKIPAACKQDISECIEQIQNTSELKVLEKCYFFYDGFKAALSTLLTDIKHCMEGNVDHPCKVLLIHANPEVGKSSLALCLAYHLALQGETAAFMKMAYTPVLDIDRATENIISASGKLETGWFILDQCNLNCVKAGVFVPWLFDRKCDKPVIVFTSGDCPPPPAWTDMRIVRDKVIDLKVDEDVVESLRESWGIREDAVKANDVLKVSSSFGHVMDCCLLCLRHQADDLVSFDALEQEIYPITDPELVALSKKPDIFWILWPEFAKAKPQDIEKRNQPEDWKVEPWQAELLGFMLSDKNDPRDVSVNPLRKWLKIGGEEEVNARDGYCEYKSHYYFFPCLQRLHNIIMAAFKVCTPQSMYSRYSELFHQLSIVSGSRVQAMRGHLFENLVRLVCEVESTSAAEPRGLHTCPLSCLSRIESTPVNAVLQIHEVDELCKMAEATRNTQEERALWCVLNAPSGKPRFCGYDFAYVHVQNHMYVEFQLFRVTVNPLTHPKKPMLDTLNEVRSKVEHACTDGSIVKPYFVCPHDTVIGKEKDIVLDRASGIFAPVFFLELK